MEVQVSNKMNDKVNLKLTRSKACEEKAGF